MEPSGPPVIVGRPSVRAVVVGAVVPVVSLGGLVAALDSPDERVFGVSGRTFAPFGLAFVILMTVLALRTIAERRRGSLIITDDEAWIRPGFWHWGARRISLDAVCGVSVTSEPIPPFLLVRKPAEVLEIRVSMADGTMLVWRAGRSWLDEPLRSVGVDRLESLLDPDALND